MRIGYLVQQFPPEVGAGPARVLEMAGRWRRAGAEVTVITALPNRPQGRIYPEYRGAWFQREMWEGLKVLRSWVYARPDASSLQTVVNNLSFMTTGALHGALRARRLDVLIASSPPFFVHAAGVLQRLIHGVPLVLELRDLWPDYLVGMGKLNNPLARSLLYKLERAMLQRAERVVVVTDSFRDRVQEKGVQRERIHVIPNGVDLDQYRLVQPQTGERQSGFRVGYLGNFGAGQDLSVVIEAAERVADHDAAIEFVLVGDGPQRSVLEAAAGQSRANLVIRPPIPKAETPDFYAGCDVCLVPLADIPIFQETIPSKLFEILASGRPVLGSLSGEGSSIIRASGGGLDVPPGDPTAIADAVLEFRRMAPEDRGAMGRRGRQYVEREYDRTRLADQYLDLLRGVGGAVRGRSG